MIQSYSRTRNLFKFIVIFVMSINLLFSSTVFAAKPDKTPPAAPTNLRAISVLSSSVSLAWNASTDNIGVKTYNIYRDSVIIGSSSTTTYTASGLKPATTYKFYVRAKDAAGNISSSSNTLTVTTSQSIPTPTPTFIPTSTLEPTYTPTLEPTSTSTPTMEQTSTLTPTPEPTYTPTSTSTPTLEPTWTSTPTLTSTPTSIPKTTRVVGYYASWAAYSGFTPDKIDASKLTHINYAFANIGTDLKIAVGDTSIDPSNFSKLKTLKQSYPGLKTLISVGGWSWSGKFSDVAYTDASRTAFADSCVAFIVQNGFDGVDIDWEYPVSGGESTNIRRPEDKHNFTLLLQKLREKLDARASLDNRPYLLTFAGAAGSWYTNNVELASLNQYVDFGNIMTYDIHGTWDSYTDFNAPLYNNSDTSPQFKWSVDSSVKTWLNAGFPLDKLVVGVPFYGYKYTTVNNANNGLYQSYSGGSSVTYANIVANYLNAPGYVRYYHQQSMVPWMFNGLTFISFDDEQSIGVKAQYIKSKGLGGAMIWELSQDPNRVLLNSLYNGLK